MKSNHPILRRPLLLLPSILPRIRVFSSESALHIRWPKYWSFSFNISPSNEHPGLISFRMDWLDLLAVQGTLKSLLQYHISLVKGYIKWPLKSLPTQTMYTFREKISVMSLSLSLLKKKKKKAEQALKIRDYMTICNLRSREVMKLTPRSQSWLVVTWIQIPTSQAPG